MKYLFSIIFTVVFWSGIMAQDYNVVSGPDMVTACPLDTITALYFISDDGTNTYDTRVEVRVTDGIDVYVNPESGLQLVDTVSNGSPLNFLWIEYAATEMFQGTEGFIIVDLSCADDACGDPIVSDTIFLTVNPLPAAEIIATETTLCDANSSILLIATDTNNTLVTYAWNDGSSDQFLTVDTAGTYWVDITNACGTNRDTILITEGGAPSVDFESSTCNYSSETLVIRFVASSLSGDSLSFVWTTNQGDTITAGGDYSIQSDSFSSTLTVIDTSGDYTNVLFNGVASNSCGSSAPFNCSEALPISLLSFEGELHDSDVMLNWKTASEINNDYFSIERSVDGISFEEVGTMTGSGTSFDVQAYHFVDQVSGLFSDGTTLYYRIKQTDYDGQFSHSHIITVTLDLEESDSYSIESAYFDGDLLNVQLDNFYSGEIQQRLISLDGRILYHAPIDLMGQRTIQLNRTNLGSGLYILELRGEKIQQSIKVFK